MARCRYSKFTHRPRRPWGNCSPYPYRWMNWATCSVACTVCTTSSTPRTRWRPGARSATPERCWAGRGCAGRVETVVSTLGRTIGTRPDTCQTLLPVSPRITKAEVLAGRAQPGGRDAAPGRLRVIQALINTMNHEFDEADDKLRTPQEAAHWLSLQGVTRGTSASSCGRWPWRTSTVVPHRDG